MSEEAREIYLELWTLCKDVERPLRHKYRSLRELFERVAREQMQNVSLQATDLAARINYLATQYSWDGWLKNALHTFRLTSNDVMNHRKEPSGEEFLRDIRSVAEAVSVMLQTSVPKELVEILPARMLKNSMKRDENVLERRIRVCFEYADEDFLYVTPVDEVSDKYWKIRYNQLGVNDEFTEGIKDYWRHAQLNLLDVKRNEDGTYTPSFIVLEPDYLVDISALAECYKDYGSHPANYIMNRLLPIDNARPLLLGNIANLFLDEWIYASE